ncbi:(4Fe-4S)-binding protein [Halomonas cupida]|uniref:(4Fe-4S)-binding protein n=1 Tax=Halomonas cupida TaxID=44933 RepID=A0A1M7JG78_9GAMM|nr:RnfABCDGE type electron transport complex subunit B [Halomonas cupida]GEN24629.1 (4Fe-4S)-binding protein [Halomonas cupida]SHM52042.1 electron transport complex protein RnfB [Halomonas cupida]
MRQPALIDAIDAALPQTQCGKCGQDGCRPYAEAVAAGEPINRCPPGGDATVVRLAELTGRPVQPLEQPAQSPLTAWIREDECIGCTKCIQACPVDAILGAAKQMHTVITSECTGCELCVAPCPVDCIDLLPHPGWQATTSDIERQAWLDERADNGRKRFTARNQRLVHEAEERRQRRAERQAQRQPPAPRPVASKPDGESVVSSSRLRTKAVSLRARLKQLTRKQQRDELSDVQRAELQQQASELQSRLAEIERQLGAAPENHPDHAEQQRRFAINAAEQARRRARQQIAHAERQQDQQAIDDAHHQLEQAERMLAEARAHSS